MPHGSGAQVAPERSRSVEMPDIEPVNEDQQPKPGEQATGQENPSIDDAPVPPLTAPDDTEGG
jgi:hypothetical protein